MSDFARDILAAISFQLTFSLLSLRMRASCSGVQVQLSSDFSVSLLLLAASDLGFSASLEGASSASFPFSGFLPFVFGVSAGFCISQQHGFMKKLKASMGG